MNALGIALVWCVLQVTLACVAGAVVYLVARKTGWAAGRMTAIGALTMVFLLTAAALSSWPSWISFKGLSNQVVVMTAPSALPEKVLPLTDVDVIATELPAQSDASGPLNLVFWRAVWAEMQRTEIVAANSSATTKNAWRWPAIVATLFLATAAIGILRLLIAWLAVRQLDRKSTTIADSHLLDLVQSISRDLSLSRSLKMKESSELQTAATFGWRQPVILLPEAWREWPVKELRAVLAHEMAHIRSGDFLTWLLAQFIVAMHFYHPLVHWLAGRLRLEQELAADATAAQFAGGRETYLQSLATLTLRADHLRPSWATQTFLPTRSTFLRRIEMLKRTKSMTSERPSGKVRLAVIGTLAAIGIFAVGLRAPGPLGATPVGAAEAAGETPKHETKTAERVAFDAAADMVYIPENAVFVARIRPFEIFQEKAMQTAAKEVNQLLASWPGWDLFSVEEIDTVLVATYEAGPDEPGVRYMFRMMEPINKVKAEEILQAYMPRGTVKVGSYYHEKGVAGGPVFSKVDDRTFLFDSSSDSFKMSMHRLASRDATPPTWLSNAKPEAATQIWCAINLQKFDSLIQNGKLGDDFPMRFAAPLFRDMQRLVASVQVAPMISVKADAACSSPEAAGRVEETASAMLVMLRNMISEQLRTHVPTGTWAAALSPTLKILQPLLEGVQVEATGKNALLTTTAELQASEFFQTLSPVIREAGESAKHSQSQNNLKKIALAMHNYASDHGHFPPAVLYDKKTGTPYSWRVAILPYMDQNEIYKRYRFEEPWDSESNMKVLEFRPMQLLSPTKPTSTNTIYFALTGPETVFAGKKGVKSVQIRDGSSNTILIVEAKRDIPWTKPEDIPYSPDKPLPKLGGFTKGGFHAAFWDGSTHFVAEDIDPKTLRNLIEKADGNAVDWPAIQK